MEINPEWFYIGDIVEILAPILSYDKGYRAKPGQKGEVRTNQTDSADRVLVRLEGKRNLVEILTTQLRKL